MIANYANSTCLVFFLNLQIHAWNKVETTENYWKYWICHTMSPQKLDVSRLRVGTGDITQCSATLWTEGVLWNKKHLYLRREPRLRGPNWWSNYLSTIYFCTIIYFTLTSLIALFVENCIFNLIISTKFCFFSWVTVIISRDKRITKILFLIS